MASDRGTGPGVLFAIDKGVQQLLSSLSETGAWLGRVRDVDIHRLGYLVDRLLESLHHNLPEAERLLYSWADTIFAPKVVLRQYLMALGLEMTLFIYHLCYRLGARLVNRMTVKGRQISETRRRMAKAKNYYEWLKCAERMDELEGKNRWREVPESTLYNHRMLQEKINQFNNMMQNGDVFQLMFVLRGGISRNQFGLLNEGLYQHAYSGTKKIVERYLEVRRRGGSRCLPRWKRRYTYMPIVVSVRVFASNACSAFLVPGGGCRLQHLRGSFPPRLPPPPSPCSTQLALYVNVLYASFPLILPSPPPSRRFPPPPKGGGESLEFRVRREPQPRQH